MNTELLNIIIPAAVALLSGGGIAACVAAVRYRKQNKRLKESEAEAAELANKLNEVELQDRTRQLADNRMDDLHDALDKMHKHFAEQTERETSKDAIIKERDATIEDKNQHIRTIHKEHAEEISNLHKAHAAEVERLNEDKLALQRKLTEKESYIGRLKLFNQWLRHWHCKRETGKKKGQCTRRKPEQECPTPFSEYPDKELLADLGMIDNTQTEKKDE